MEKQPIDDLFKRKLHDAEIAPGDAAWNVLQNRLGNRRVVPIWTYVAIVASLLIVGAFGWWALVIRDNAGSSTMMARNVVPIKKLKPPVETQQMARRNEDSETSPLRIGQLPLAEDGLKKMVLHQPAKKFAINIAQGVGLAKKRQKATPENNTVLSSNPAKQDEKAEIAQITLPPNSLESTLSESANKELSNVKTPTPNERTLIVSIESPVALTPKPVQTIALATNYAPKSSLGSLFSKVKKIKDGEALALSTTKTVKSGRRGFGKFYDDIKESIQNNAADE